MIELDEFLDNIGRENRDIETLTKAYRWGAMKHDGQLRKNSGLPYFIHPVRVARNLKAEDDEMIIAGLLHDVLEDTNGTYDEIREQFGYRVAELVKGMTKTEEISMFQAMDSVINEFPEVVTIKVSDRIDNLTDKFESMPESTKERYRTETPEIIAYAEKNNKLNLVKELKNLREEIEMS